MYIIYRPFKEHRNGQKQLRVRAKFSVNARTLKTTVSDLRTGVNSIQYFCYFLFKKNSYFANQN